MDETTNNTDRELLVTLARRVHAEQEKRGWSNARMVGAYNGLGSTKTYQLIREGKLDGLEIERWLAGYRGAAYQLDIEESANLREERVFKDLGPVLELQNLARSLMRTTSNRRFATFAAESGCGKTKAVESLCQDMPNRFIKVEADDTWGDSPVAMLGAILAARGAAMGAPQAAARMEACKAALRQSRVCLVIDEAHHIGARGLNIIKTLVNATPGEFILVGIPKLMENLECTHHMELKQLTSNRLNARVWFRFELVDAEAYLRNALAGLKMSEKTLKSGAERVYKAAGSMGNLCFVAAVCDFVAEYYATADEITAEHIALAVEQEKARRMKKQK